LQYSLGHGSTKGMTIIRGVGTAFGVRWTSLGVLGIASTVLQTYYWQVSSIDLLYQTDIGPTY
jgi:hypothetical protein